jgi:hypothetical protein
MGGLRLSNRGIGVPAWLLLTLLLLMPSSAQAYVDPGAGTMIWQMLVAGFLGAIFYLRRLIPSRRSKKKEPPEAGPGGAA